MSYPISAIVTGVTAAGSYCTLQAGPLPLNYAPGNRVSTPLLEDITWDIVATSGQTATNASISFQELGLDGTFRTLRVPPPFTVFSSCEWRGKWEGRVLGFQFVIINGLTGGTISYARLSATVRGL